MMSGLRRRTASGDAGQMPIALIMLTMLGLLVVIFWVGLPIGQATDQKAGSQSAADAAAPAAGEQIREGLAQEIRDATLRLDGDTLGRLFESIGAGFGSDAAQDYADRNGA